MSEKLTQHHINQLKTSAFDVDRDDKGRLKITRHTLEDLGFDLAGINIKTK